MAFYYAHEPRSSPPQDAQPHSHRRCLPAGALVLVLLLLLGHSGSVRAACGLLNPGFEEVDAQGAPLDWALFREAFCDDNTSLAHTGRRSIRSSAAFGWSQFMGVPCSPGQSFAVRGYAAREFSFEKAAVRCSFFGDSGMRYLMDRQDLSPVSSLSGFGEFAAVLEVPGEADTVGVYPVGQSVQNWIRFDDLAVLTEQLAMVESPCAEGWTVDAGAVVANDTLYLTDGTSVSQRVVTGRQNQAYFVTGSYATTSSGTLTVTDEWLPRGTDEQGTVSLFSVDLVPPSGIFVADPGRPAQTATGISRIRIAVNSPDVVAITSVTRGFAKVEPLEWTVGDASPDKPLSLTAAWPGQLTSATIDIITSTGFSMAHLPVNMEGTTARSSWDGSGAQAGAYSARFTLLQKSGQPLMLLRPFELYRADGLTSPVSPYSSPSFTRAAWVFSVFDSNQRLDQLVELTKADGYNMVFGHCSAAQVAQLRASAERLGLRFVPTVPEVSGVLQQYIDKDFFSRRDYLEQVHAIVSPALGSPFLSGIYIIDEPATANALDVTRRGSLSVAQDGSLGAAFSVVPPVVSPSDLVLAGTPVCLVDIYPYRPFQAGTNSDALRGLVSQANAYVAAAAGSNRELWLVLQSFEEPGVSAYHAVPNTIHWGQLGGAVLAGAKGVVPFVYSAVSFAEGQRGPDLGPTRKLAPYQRFNSLMDRLGPLVMQWTVPVLDSRAPAPFMVSVAEAGPADKYAVVLNSDDRTTQVLNISMSSSLTVPLQDLVLERTLPLDPMERVVVELGAGEWAVIPIGSNAIASYYGTSYPGEPLSTFVLPTTHEFVVRRTNGLAQPVLGLDFNSSGDHIAVSTGVFSGEPDSPQVYLLDPSGTVVRESGLVTYPADRTFFARDGLLARCSLSLGARFYPESAVGGAPVLEYTGVSGGAYSATVQGSAVWLTMAGYGIRRLADTGSGLESVDLGISQSDIYRDLFGPFSDGSVSLVVRNNGVHNVKIGLLQESSHIRADLNRTDTNADLNEAGILAVPRNQRGVGLFQLNAAGEPTLIGTAATDAVEVNAAAWLDNQLLALADSSYHVRFYRVTGGNAVFTGTWRPGAGEPIYIRALASHAGKLAAGLQDGRVIVVNAEQLLVNRSRGWQHYQ